MGNASKKLAAKCTLLTKDEQKHVAATFRTASKNSDKIREEDLIVSATLDHTFIDRFWGPQIDPRLAQYLSNYLFGSGANKNPTVDFNRFAELYVYNVRGTTDERMTVTYQSLGMEYSQGKPDGMEVPTQLLKEYCESIASTYIKMLKASESHRSQKWISKGFRGRPQHVQALGESLAASASGGDELVHHVPAPLVYRWLDTDVLLKHLSELVFLNLYGVGGPGGHSPYTMLPRPEGLDPMPDYPAFIDLSHIVWLNSHIPTRHQHQWRFLFSSHIHGESFSTLSGRIQEQGASLLIIEDTSGYIFGGYASHSWALGPHFVGGEESFLFTLAPRMRMFPSSGFNDHYQYLNHHTKTMPNGLLMGGQLEFGAIWVNAEPFGGGSSAESCTTYRSYHRLSKEPTFKIRSLEVWAVGDKPLTVKESVESHASHSSVIQERASERNFLAVIGKPMVSDGFRS